MFNQLSYTTALPRFHSGPLGHHIDGFTAYLLGKGYKKATTEYKVQIVTCFGKWLYRQRFDVRDLDEQKVSAFLMYKQYSTESTRTATLHQLLNYLRKQGVIPLPISQIDNSPRKSLERDFMRYLLEERALAQTTTSRHLFWMQRFLSEIFNTSRIDFRKLDVRTSNQFILRHAQRRATVSASGMVASMRYFLRFLYLRGDIVNDLSASVPNMAHWRLSTIPRYISKEHVKQLLDGCNRRTATGMRNYAMLLLLARLGLRAGELVAMELEDIDWEVGELTVRGKGLRRDRLPLPPDVGKALARYLRYGRPRCPTRRVFVRRRAPHESIGSSTTISNIVRRTLERVGLDPPTKGTNLLRHSLATEMLRKGASLSQIGEILRHQKLNTTQIYAKVDLVALRKLAQPWPGDKI